MALLSKDDYIMEAYCQVSDELHYLKLSADPTAHHTTSINEFVHLMFTKGLIEKKVMGFLIPSNPLEARFYHL